MRKIDLRQIGRIMDVSAVRTDVDFHEINQMIEIVRKYHCICASPMPWATRYTVEQLSDMEDAVVTGVVGFPSGADTTFIKVATAKEMLAVGCRELDMVINVSALKSGKYQVVENDIRAVVESANDIPVKTIIEICYLSDDEIRRASELAVKAGAAFVKTGTGWGPRPTTVETIRLIRKTIGSAAKIKAAGGIRDLDTMLQMVEAGCDRFGIGVRSASAIIEEAARRADEMEMPREN
ncbi:MAG: deoxyribose-phosphate aldolase [Lachnospiraceae bacterium]